MLFLVSALRAVVEMIGLCLIGRGMLYVVAGAARERNIIYRLFVIVTEPPCRLVRLAMPRLVADRITPPLTFFLFLVLWIVLAWVRKIA